MPGIRKVLSDGYVTATIIFMTTLLRYNIHPMQFIHLKFIFYILRVLPDPGIEPGSAVLKADSLPSEPPGKPIFY